MIARAQIAAVLLAGGRGRRMGGADKGWVLLRGRPLIEHAIAAIAPQAGSLLISANRNQARYAALGYPLALDDRSADFAGPLSGIAAALARVTAPYLLVAPCDMPYLPADLAARLAEALTAAAAPAAVARGGGRVQPLCVLLRRAVARDLRRYRESGGAEVERWLRGLPCAEADFSDRPHAFLNINTPEDLRGAEDACAEAPRAD